MLAAGDARWYCGLSGLSHALLAAALSYEFAVRRGVARAIVAALGAAAAAKLLYEVATGAPAFATSLGIAQVPLAHAVGVCIGIACGLGAGRERHPAMYACASHPPSHPSALPHRSSGRPERRP
ncbi:MAG: hypothetical protein E6J90_30185 [Deltaproteobacteria bacterium]|nr:MAG: hypothetical protein E6J91_34055 [Deltaproteobacteria bacterium]TMQ12836.1 MAG: hypothetical protein E6J90_30185 [Deltaproteobacteria bacterium]